MTKVTELAKAITIRIAIDNIKPEIWRRFVIRDSINLHNLHEIIQDVMGWTNTHLYSFVIKGKEYTDEETVEESGKGKDAEVISVGSLKFKKGDKLKYIYDFGDDWIHTLSVEAVTKPDPSIEYPWCLDGARSCPPEDCGGIYGYEDLLDILSNPNHEEHESMKEWVGPYFAPEHFDLEVINHIFLSYCKE